MSAAIRKALEVLSEPGQVIELRIPRARHTRSGYFDDLDRAVEAAAKLNGTESVYVHDPQSMQSGTAGAGG